MEINDFDNYLIYDNGQVWSKKRKIFLKQTQSKENYMFVNLSRNGKQNHIRAVHVLVAKHYIENPENLPVVHHKDGDKTNNNVNNLFWDTAYARKSKSTQNIGFINTNTSGIKNISPHRNNYIYQKNFNNKKHQKIFKTLEEAIEYKEEYEKSLQVQ